MTTPFKWKEYLSVAKRVVDDSSSNEASCRMAISRSYYAAFHTVKNLMQKKHGLKFSKKSVHANVYRSFNHKYGAESYRLEQPWEWRRRADYEDNLPNIDWYSQAKSCFEIANELVADIEMREAPFK